MSVANSPTVTLDHMPDLDPSLLPGLPDLILPTTAPSPASSSQGPETPGSTHHAYKRSKEATAFLRDLSNYVALGCLVLEDFTLHARESSQAEWTEVFELPWLLGFNSTLQLSLQINRLIDAGWLRAFTGRSVHNTCYVIYRLYILPYDAGNRFVDRKDFKLYGALQSLLFEVDVSPSTWCGDYVRETQQRFDVWASRGGGSLFYTFNKLKSPSPSAEHVDEKYAHEALEDLLDPASVLPGLQTVLYPYQRRSAGLMLQRESVASLVLDPRLEQRTGPDGSTYYYGGRDGVFLRTPRYYEACKGGILAETMGLGKTVMLLALILATKHHPPKIPAEYALPPVRPKVGRLSEMAISIINRKSVPWKVEFERIKQASGNDMRSCQLKLEASPPTYEIPQVPQRWNRKTALPPPKTMTMASTSIIVVPRNLCKQWHSEIEKHVEAGALKVLIMEDLKRALPPADELRTYDVVLFSRNRFEMEIRDGSDEQGRRILATQLVCRCPYVGATRTRDCHCVRTDELYDSPLKYLHFKRLVIDEGHFFSNSNNTAVTVANKLVKADHRWVVSGTPAKDLLGVEVDMSNAENAWHDPDTEKSRESILDQRREFSSKEDTSGAIKSLGVLASNFLRIRPWCAQGIGEKKEAEWDEYIYRHEDLRKRTYSGFATCLRRTLEAMVVKTQPEDVERDIELPPLSHEVVRLEPSLYDKLTANLFTLVLTANAITSERTDADYLFHRNSAKARYQLISNLRQSAFFWTGFSEADVAASLKNSRGYLEKEGTNCTPEDRQLLTEMLDCAEMILASDGWKALSRSHEMGLFVDDWPEESAQHWGFDTATAPLMTGISQLLEAQKHVNERAGNDDPGEDLSGAGIRAIMPAHYGDIKREGDESMKKAEKPVLTKAGIPTSSLDGEPVLKRRSSATAKATKSGQAKITRAVKVMKPQKRSASNRSKPSSAKLEAESEASASTSPATAGTLASASRPNKKRRRSDLESIDFHPASAFLRSRIVGTTSAKLSYLISQILKHYKDEKILIFYDGDNVAYYIAQALELLHVKHEIYAKSLAAHLKSEYVVRFDQEQQDRVLLMDVKQAAFGLNLSSASRIYFVNPVCRPNVEAQAIKRAHRIGQTRKVVVETLVLKGSIEEKMLERAKRMTRSEHRDAKVLEDDGGIREIIQGARMLPVLETEKSSYGQVARFDEPQQLWGREGWKETVSVLSSPSKPAKKQKVVKFDEIAEAGGEAKLVQSDEEGTACAKRKGLSFVDRTNPDAEAETVEESSDDEPMADVWRRRRASSSASGRQLCRSAFRSLRGADVPLTSAYEEAQELLTHVLSPLSTPTRPDFHMLGRPSHAHDTPIETMPMLTDDTLICTSPRGQKPVRSEMSREELLQDIIRRL